MRAKNAMLCWTPDSKNVDVVPYPDSVGYSNKFLMTALGCYASTKELSFEQAKTLCFIEAMVLIIRDKCDPSAVHRAMCKIDEYVDGLPDDMQIKG